MQLLSLNLNQFWISNNYREQYQKDSERIQMKINILKNKIEKDTSRLNKGIDSENNDSNKKRGNQK